MSNKLLWSQATHTLTLIEQQNPNPEHIKTLHDGYLTDLVRAIIDDTLPSRDKIRSFYGLEALSTGGKPSNILVVDYDMPLEQMIASGNYGDDGKGNNWNKDITAQRFPTKGKGKVEFEHKLFHFGRNIASDEAKREIIASDPTNPWQPARIEHVTAYGAKYPEEQRKYPIIGLGSVGKVLGSRRAPGLGVDDDGRRLGLFEVDHGWYAHFRFLAVRIVTAPLVA